MTRPDLEALTRAFAIAVSAFAAAYMAVVAGEALANPYGTALSQQAVEPETVSPLAASIAIAGD